MSVCQPNETRSSVSPSVSLIEEYPTLQSNEFKLSPDGLSVELQQHVWEKLTDYCQKYSRTMLGYQGNMNLDGNSILGQYMEMHISNVGDLDTQGGFNPNTKAMERAVLDYMAKLWHIQHETMKDGGQAREYYGYLGSSGTTEGNLFSLYNARAYLSGKPLLHISDLTTDSKTSETNSVDDTVSGSLNFATPVVFYTGAAHQSLNKAIEFLNMATFHDVGSGQFSSPLHYPDDYPPGYSESFLDENGWPYYVPACADDTVHIPSLLKLVKAFASRGYPPVVVFTVGTSFRGSYEDPASAIHQLVPILKEHNLYKRKVYYSKEDPSLFDIRHGFWFHIDGALGAGHLPFLEIAIDKGLVDNVFPHGFPVFDFRISEVMSIALSIYKWFGSPLPSSIVMVRKKNIVKIQRTSVASTAGPGATTFFGCRSGLAVMVMWNTLARAGQLELAERAAKQERLVQYSLEKLRELEKSIGEDLWLSRSPGSLLICMKLPRKDVVSKYSLFCTTVHAKSTDADQMPQKRKLCHICIMSHVDEKLIDEFIGDLKEIKAFPLQDAI